LMNAVETASKYVSSKVRAAGIYNLYGAEGGQNASGDHQQKIDVLANEAFITSLKRSHAVSTMVSEENKDIVVSTPTGRYAAVFDPLDGSSNIDVNISIGTIFGVYKRKDSTAAPKAEDVLIPGSELVAAGYTMYGSATILVLTVGAGVYGFTLDPNLGDFVLSHPDIKIKPKHTIYSINEGNAKYWDEPTKKYVESIKFPKDEKVKPYSMRYVGSMVADVHRTLIYGGIFMYPGDSNAKDGKLRLLYEANPMALLIEKAGGRATTGTQRILDVAPKSIHQRVPVFLGSKDNVAELENFYKQHVAK